MPASKVNICLVGDVFPADLPNNLGLGVASKFFSTEQALWTNCVKQIIGNQDIIFCNLESPLILPEQHTPDVEFAGSKKFARFLSDSGFNIASIANNHILEHGAEGLSKTVKALTEQGIQIIGLSEQGNLSNIVYLEVKEIKLAFASFSAVQDNNNAGYYAAYSEETVLEVTRTAKAKNADYVIISLHWGDEYINIPHRKQVEAARNFIDNGVDVIVGHHPHVIQPFERYKNGLIFYSLGNFIFDMVWSKNVRLGLVIHLSLENDNIDFEAIPTLIGPNYIPQTLTGSSLKTFNNGLQKRSNRFHALTISSPNLYDGYYSKMQKTNHIYQRYKMKENLFIQFENLPKSTQARILLRIKNRLLFRGGERG